MGKLYKAPPKVELSAEDRVYSNQGMELSTKAPGGIAGTGIKAASLVQLRAHQQKEAPAPPPATWDAYGKKSGSSTGVISMIDLLISDLEKELMATDKYISSLHAECDWLVQYFDVRKEARAGE